MKRDLPHRTIERLSMYSNCLTILLSDGREYVFSHPIAAYLHLTSVQVRRILSYRI
jgi:NADH/NAD ratio-sensing transcriptional regulator Rex